MRIAATIDHLGSSLARVAAGILLGIASISVGEASTAPLSTLDPAGPSAAAIATIWWIMLWGSVVILAAVLALVAYPFIKARAPANVPTAPFLWGGGLVFPIVVLAALLGYALPVGQALVSGGEPGMMRVEARAHQWWWEFVYPDAEGGPLYTAAELHIPAGQRVEVRVTSDDVIHSFWVPRLGGKIDAIPGLTNVITLQADRSGLYWGQCSEFCGMQHAAMGFLVEAHAPDAFAERRAALAASAPGDAHPGAPDFAANCAGCHSVDPAVRGDGAPNLAGLAERRRLGSGAMVFAGRADLRRWLREHETLKPGSRKPSHAEIDAATLDRIVSYLTQ